MHECVDAWVGLMRLLLGFFFIFPFFINLRNVGGVNHWWCMTCYDFLFKPRRWCMHGCVDAWVEFALFKKMNYSCVHDLVWCMNYSFAFYWNQIRIGSYFIVISNLWNHSTLIFFYFSKSFLWSNLLLTNHFFYSFFWNTIWMTPMKLPRAWKGLDEVMKIN